MCLLDGDMLGDRQITANFVKYRLTISLTQIQTEISCTVMNR